MNFVMADSPFETSVTTPRVGVDELVTIADDIWAVVRERLGAFPPTDYKSAAALLKEMQDRFKDFTNSFPIVLQWMVNMREYQSKVMRRFLLHHASVEVKSKDDFLDLQGDYLMYMYMASHPHRSQREYLAHRDQMRKMLHDEDREFVRLHDEAEAEVKRRAEKNLAANRADIFRALLREKQQ
jgi:hypothetical protein